jgi:hypothetical protein
MSFKSCHCIRASKNEDSYPEKGIRDCVTKRSMRWQGFFRSSDPDETFPAGDGNQVTLLSAKRPCLTPLLDAGNTATVRQARLPQLRFIPGPGPW